MSTGNAIQELLNSSIQKKIDKSEHRDYMGASGLATQCDRALWYSYHQPKKDFPPRVQMIFDMGHIIEDYLVKIFRDAGLTIYNEDSSGEQFGFVDGFIAGHIDGVITGIPGDDDPHLLEFKSSNDKRFKDFQKKGCQAVEPKYWGQCHIYMHKMNLKKCLFVVMNKNTCDLYFEIINLDPIYADSLLLRGEELVAQTVEREVRKRYKTSTSFGCRFCSYKEECWRDEHLGEHQ